MNLFDKLKNSKSTPSLSVKRGNFVVDDSIGISLLTALNYFENKDRYLLITSNLYKAQEIYSLICSFIDEKDVLLFPADELIRAETLAQTKEMVAHRLFVLNELINKTQTDKDEKVAKLQNEIETYESHQLPFDMEGYYITCMLHNIKIIKITIN